jgi:hypothetical protein
LLITSTKMNKKVLKKKRETKHFLNLFHEQE